VPTLLERAPLDPGAFTALASGTIVEPSTAAASAPGNPLEWFAGLIPSNPFQALAEGEILAILIFVVLFALAATRLQAESRDLLVRIGAAVAEMSMTLVRWLLIPLPLAVFALAYPMAIETGSSVVGAVVWYVAVVCMLLITFTAIVYLITWVGAGISPVRFQRGITDAQLVAVGTRSSLASLPAMLVGARERLELDEDVSNLVLPLAVSAFKVNRTVTSPFKLLFLAHMYGLVVTPEYLTIYVGTLILLSFATPGLPSRSTFGVMLPFYMAAGIPVEGVVLMSAVDAIPDVFKTLVNVTADVSVTAIVARVLGRSDAKIMVAPGIATATIGSVAES